MFDRERIRGIIPPLATPLTPEEELDEEALRRLIRRLLDAGCHGAFVLGGTGEGIYLTDAVQAHTIEVTVDEVAGRVPVVAGVSDLSVRRAVARGRLAAQLGADVIISVPPYQRPMEPMEVRDYFVALAEETGMPTMLYNVPPFVRTDITVDTIAELAGHDGIIGMKDSADLAHLSDVALATQDTGFRLLCGFEPNFAPAMMIGAAGGTLAIANVWPEICVETYDACAAGDWERARRLQLKLTRFLGPFTQAPWTPACKYAMSLLGLCRPATMRPDRPLTEGEQNLIRETLSEWELI